MREFKFRAWLPNARRTVWVGNNPPDRRKKGRMVEFDELYFSISHDSLEHPQLLTDTPEHFYGEDIDKSAEGAILMQFTGLKDKNGKEIYEGDVLRGDYYLLSVVEFVGARFRINVKEKQWQYGPKKVGFASRLKELGVIGNIHENPELLTPAKEAA